MQALEKRRKKPSDETAAAFEEASARFAGLAPADVQVDE
jgi:hypothetical protein